MPQAVDARGRGGLSARVVVPRRRLRVDVALDVAAGETVAIMGPSGAGKSTLLAALAGLEPLAEGEVVVAGRVVDKAPAPRVHVAASRRGIVLLGQDPRLFPHLTARENVAFGPRARGIPRSDAHADADAWLARVGLPGAGSRRPAELSGGEQQRVAVARALAAGPHAVLLDEPLVALDPATAGEIRGMLRERLTGRTVIAVTHDATDALALADRLLVIEQGALTQAGPVREVLAAPGSPFVAAVAGLNRLVGGAREGGWEREGVRLEAEDAASQAAVRTDGARVAAVFRPAVVSVRADDARPARNEWRTRVLHLEPTLGGVLVRTPAGDAEVEAARGAGLGPGAAVILGVAARDVRLIPA